MTWFYEFLLVLTHSKRTQWAIIFGLVFFCGILIWGNHQANNFEMHGQLSILTDAMREIIIKHYNKAAWGSLAAFWGLAFKLYKKDKKRLLGSIY